MEYEKLIYRNERSQSIEFSIFTPFVIKEHEGLTGLENVINTIRSMNQDGSTVVNQNIDNRNITIIGTIVDDVDLNKDRLISILNPKLKGELEYIKGNTRRVIPCYIEQLPSINNEIYPEFFISLLCPKAFLQDTEESKEDISTETGNFEFPLEIPVEGLELSIRTISYITNIYNQGDVDTPIKVKLKAVGTVINPIIENLDTGEFIRVKRELAEGDTLEINTAFGNKRVELIQANGSRENVFHYIDYKSTFFSLEGGDNTIKYDAEVGENNLDVSIYYTPNYLGI